MTRRTTESGSYTRTILPPLQHQWTESTACAWPWLGLGGDELRVRAWLWRFLGVGAAAAGRQQ